MLFKPKGTDLKDRGGDFSLVFKGRLLRATPVPVTRCALNCTH